MAHRRRHRVLRAGADARGARPQALRILAIGAETRQLQSGEVLFDAGELADGGYVVQEGSFAARAGDADRAGKDYTRRPGHAARRAGAAHRDGQRRSPRSRASRRCVIRIPRSLFLKMLEGYPDAAQRMRDIMAERGRQLDARTARRVKGALEPTALEPRPSPSPARGRTGAPQPRESLAISIVETRSASAADVQMWSSRRPRSAAAQLSIAR